MTRNTKRNIIPDRFQQMALINTGGFAEVWKAKDTITDATVAIKIPLRGDKPRVEPAVVDKFERERKILQTIRGGPRPSSIIRYFDSQTGGIPHIACEYVDGAGLDNHLQQMNQKPGREAVCNYAIPIMRGIEFLHSNGIAHLDLKPENILVRSASGKPVLIDFNTAVMDMSVQRTFITDDFKSPEQIERTSYEYNSAQQADIYAVGKLIYYLLSGKTNAVKTEPPQAISDAAKSAGFPDEIISLLTRMVMPDPSERIDNIGMIISALRDKCQYPNIDYKRGRLVDPEGPLNCPVYPGDSIGRMTTDNCIPEVLISDPDEYISPHHFALIHDGESWIIQDKSLNGTYVDYDSETYFLLSDDGYTQLSVEVSEHAPNSPPPSAMRVRHGATIRPVSKEYPDIIEFELQ